MNENIKKIYTKLKREKLDALFISSNPNISYLTDYISRDSFFLISEKGNIYFTDSRYIDEAKKNLRRQAAIKKISGPVFRIIADACKDMGIKRLGCEERHLAFDEYKNLRKALNEGIQLISTHSLIEELRQIKQAEELKKIKKAIQITVDAFKFIKGFILPGKKELQVAAELERFIRYNGAYAAAFDIIVASGPNSSLPHHLTSERKIRNNELLLIDIGVSYLGYKSDLTRVFFLGKINPAVRRIYDIVKEAQDKAVRKIKPRAFINKIDAAARQYIAQRGYGGFFGHNLGHGVGLEVHETPHISSKETAKLKPGMVFTIEPGIYLPGRFGIRIEDMVMVTKEGCEVLSGALHK